MRKLFTDRTSPNAEDIAGIYDSHASTWLQRESRAETKLASQQWRSDLLSHLHGDVLEIGVAAGDTLVRLREKSHDIVSYTGIDLSPAMIEQAKRAGEGAQFPVHLLPMDAEDLGAFPDNSFDTVTTSMVFCTIPDVPRALSEITRVLRPNGKLVMIEHVLSPNLIIAGAQKLLAPLQLRQMGCHLDRRTVETLIAHGFRIDEQRQRIFGVMRFIIASPPG